MASLTAIQNRAIVQDSVTAEAGALYGKYELGKSVLHSIGSHNAES
jgi:hypothetical protein